MTDFSWSLSHRQLVSAVIALVLPDGLGLSTPFRDLGYELGSLELPIADRFGRPYQIDLHLTHETQNLSLLVECKTNPAVLEAVQIEKYMATTGEEAVIAANLTLTAPRQHRADVVFVVLPNVENALAGLVAACPSILVAGWGLVRVSPSRIELAHDELSDHDFAASLTAGWDIDVEGLPLERLPYEPDSPEWDLADALFQTMNSMFMSGRREFGVDDLCVESNELWPFLEPQHDHIRQRVRNEVRTFRRTALKGRIARVDSGTGREERWRFVRRPTTNRNVIASFAKRHQRYVSILLNEGRNPRADDFVKIDPEQLIMEFPAAES